MKNKAYKYENLHIGNFLVSVGYYLRGFDYKFPVSMNLHQQTPNDFTIGDLFGAFAGKYFLIEFKNDKTSIADELKKPQRSELIKKLSNEYKNLIDVSVYGHFFCYPVFKDGAFDFTLEPYLNTGISTFDECIIHGIQEFLKMIIKQEILGVSYEEIEDYIKLLELCATEHGAKGSSATSGIFLNFDEKEGIRYMIFDDLNFLNMQIHLEQEIIIELKRKMELTHDDDKKIRRGFGMGM